MYMEYFEFFNDKKKFVPALYRFKWNILGIHDYITSAMAYRSKILTLELWVFVDSWLKQSNDYLEDLVLWVKHTIIFCVFLSKVSPCVSLVLKCMINQEIPLQILYTLMIYWQMIIYHKFSLSNDNKNRVVTIPKNSQTKHMKV